jgi:hypothetical protein
VLGKAYAPISLAEAEPAIDGESATAPGEATALVGIADTRDPDWPPPHGERGRWLLNRISDSHALADELARDILEELVFSSPGSWEWSFEQDRVSALQASYVTLEALWREVRLLQGHARAQRARFDEAFGAPEARRSADSRV